MRRFVAAAAMVILSCGVSPPSPDASVDGGTDAGIASCHPDRCACSGLAEAECRTSGCEPIRGKGAPDASSTYAGCRTPDGSGGLGCFTAYACAQAPDAGCWFFTDQCVPDGWSRLDCQLPACPRP